jgi:type II secretory pathway pseudopilin PulG
MPSILPKAFIYGFVVAIANFTPYIEKAIAETTNTVSGQAAIAGTWKLTPQKPQAYNLRARQSEAKAYIGSMNRAQQAYFLEQASWSKNTQDLGIDIKPETKNYRYSLKIDSAIATSKTKPYPGIAINLAIAKQPDLKSYVGIVYVQHSPNSNDIDDITSWAILCQSNQPTMKTPSQPTWNGKQMLCPDGYIAIDR